MLGYQILAHTGNSFRSTFVTYRHHFLGKLEAISAYKHSPISSLILQCFSCGQKKNLKDKICYKRTVTTCLLTKTKCQTSTYKRQVISSSFQCTVLKDDDLPNLSGGATTVPLSNKDNYIMKSMMSAQFHAHIKTVRMCKIRHSLILIILLSNMTQLNSLQILATICLICKCKKLNKTLVRNESWNARPFSFSFTSSKSLYKWILP